VTDSPDATPVPRPSRAGDVSRETVTVAPPAAIELSASRDVPRAVPREVSRETGALGPSAGAVDVSVSRETGVLAPPGMAAATATATGDDVSRETGLAVACSLWCEGVPPETTPAAERSPIGDVSRETPGPTGPVAGTPTTTAGAGVAATDASGMATVVADAREAAAALFSSAAPTCSEPSVRPAPPSSRRAVSIGSTARASTAVRAA
jgi:hypothetical protein